jgi:hypothetical protein
MHTQLKLKNVKGKDSPGDKGADEMTTLKHPAQDRVQRLDKSFILIYMNLVPDYQLSAH